jgi:hypothetical protein
MTASVLLPKAEGYADAWKVESKVIVIQLHCWLNLLPQRFSPLLIFWQGGNVIII